LWQKAGGEFARRSDDALTSGDCASRERNGLDQKSEHTSFTPQCRGSGCSGILLFGLLCPERSTRSNMHHFRRLEAKTSSQVWPCLLCASQGGAFPRCPCVPPARPLPHQPSSPDHAPHAGSLTRQTRNPPRFPRAALP